MINNGEQPGHGLGEGNPAHARLAVPRLVAGQGLAAGRLLQWIRNHSDSALARLGRYVVVRYNPRINLDALVIALSNSPMTEYVEKNKRFRLSAIPNDPGAVEFNDAYDVEIPVLGGAGLALLAHVLALAALRRLHGRPHST